MLHLVTGGSGSGKSAFAEQQVMSLGEERKRVYIATMYPGDDPENQKRISRHRAMRAPKNFETVEIYNHLGTVVVPRDSVCLLECMSNLVANEMYLPEGAGIHTVNAVLEGIDRLQYLTSDLVIVTNEVFSDGNIYDEKTSMYLEFLGIVNQEIASRADLVTEVVYGIPVPVKTAAGAEHYRESMTRARTTADQVRSAAMAGVNA